MHGVKRLESFESTWLIQHWGPFKARQTLNNRRRTQKKKELKSGNIGSKSAEFVVGSGSIVTFIHSLTQKEQHIRVRARGSKLQSKCKLLLVDTKVTVIFLNWQADVCFVH